jgi:hypothetical protein
MRKIVGIVGILLLAAGMSVAQNPDSAWLSMDSLGYPVLTEHELDLADTVQLNAMLLNASDSLHAIMYPICYDIDHLELLDYSIDSAAFPTAPAWTVYELDTIMNDSGKVFFYAFTPAYVLGIPEGTLSRIGYYHFSSVDYDTSAIDTCWYPPQGHLLYTDGRDAVDYFPDWTSPTIITPLHGAVIAVHPDSFHFELMEDETDADVMHVLDLGDSTLTVDSIVGYDTSWIALDTTAFDVLPGDSQAVQIEVDAIGIPVGSYCDTLMVYSNSVIHPEYEVIVCMDVLPPTPDIVVEPDELHFLASIDTFATDLMEDFWVMNTGDGGLSVDSIVSSMAWATPDTTMFTVAVGDTQMVTVTADTAGLGMGTHYDTLVIFSDDPDEPEYMLPIYLHIGNPDSAWLSLDITGYPVFDSIEIFEDTPDTTFTMHFMFKSMSDTGHAFMFPVGWPTDYFDLDDMEIDTTMFPDAGIYWTLFERDTTVDSVDMLLFYGWTAVYDFGVPPGLHRMGEATLTTVDVMRHDTFEIGAIDTVLFPPAGRLIYSHGPSAHDYWPEWTPVEVVYWYAVDELGSMPTPMVTFLAPNRPNPFRTTTEISYGLKTDAHVDIAVYDAAGRRVVTLVKGHQDAGVYTITWNGKDSFNRRMSAGVYLLRMKSRDFESTRKLLIH